jgi:hypothetical protein
MIRSRGKASRDNVVEFSAVIPQGALVVKTALLEGFCSRENGEAPCRAGGYLSERGQEFMRPSSLRRAAKAPVGLLEEGVGWARSVPALPTPGLPTEGERPSEERTPALHLDCPPAARRRRLTTGLTVGLSDTASISTHKPVSSSTRSRIRAPGIPRSISTISFGSLVTKPDSGTEQVRSIGWPRNRHWF